MPTLTEQLAAVVGTAAAAESARRAFDGTALRDWRTRRAMTLAELAAAMGLSKSYLSLIEDGRVRVAVEFAKKMLAFMETYDVVPS